MLCSDDLSKLLSEFIAGQPCKNSDAKSSSGDNSSPFSLAPTQLLVIGGILTNVLTVESVLIDKDQKIEILLSGSLKRKTELDKMLDEIGSMPFDDVLKAVLSRGE